MKIERGDREGQWRLLREQNMLCGLITKVKDNQYRVEMFMKVDAVMESEKEAVAFAKGVWSACMAFNVYRQTTPSKREREVPREPVD